jgi:DDE superfamily endonuclease
MNKIFYETLECFIKWASPLVLKFQGNYLRSRAQLYARKIAAKSRNATQHCLGFIDGTLIEIARLPGLMQRAMYSGHKRRPGLKWQVVTTPDGMLFHVFGPFEGRRHDMDLYAGSGICSISRELSRYYHDTCEKCSFVALLDMDGVFLCFGVEPLFV